MPNKQPSYRLTGNNPLAYMGVEPYTPPQLETHSYNPTINDNNFNIGTIWTTRNPAPITIWMLADQSNPLPGNAKWVQLYPNSGGSIEFVGNLGSATASAGILNVPGTSVIATSGSGNTLTIEMTNGSDGQVIIGGGAAPAWANITAGSGITITNGANSIQIASSSGQGVDSVPCDTGSAAPVAGVLNIYGSNLINTNGSGNTVTVALNKANNGYIPIGSTGNPTVMAPITAGSGITVTNASNSITIATTAVRTVPTGSGTATPVAGALTIAGANLINTSASGSTVTVALNKSNDGQIPIGSTGNPTVMANITSLDGTVTITNGSNTIDISAAGEVNPAFTCNFFLYQTVPSLNTNVTTSTTVYLGQLIALTKKYDAGNNCTVGSGTGLMGSPATFTAPGTGIYLLGMQFRVSGSIAIAPNTQPIITTNSGNYLIYPSFADASESLFVTSGTVIANMSAGDVARFGFNYQCSNSQNFRIEGAYATYQPTNVFGIGVYAWGYRIA